MENIRKSWEKRKIFQVKIKSKNSFVNCSNIKFNLKVFAFLIWDSSGNSNGWGFGKCLRYIITTWQFSIEENWTWLECKDYGNTWRKKGTFKTWSFMPSLVGIKLKTFLDFLLKIKQNFIQGVNISGRFNLNHLGK